jgi:hypothetical protein
MRNTHTYVTLEISAAGYDEIAKKLRDAEYHHCFNAPGEIDMLGIAVVRGAESGPKCWSCGQPFPIDAIGIGICKCKAYPLARTEGQSADHHTEGSAKP